MNPGVAITLGGVELIDQYVLRSNSRRLGRNITAETGQVRQRDEEAHHIVAAEDRRAGQARQILAQVGIDINSAENGVFMNGTGHRGLHTNAYYNDVNQRLDIARQSAVAEFPNDLGAQRAAVVSTLHGIRTEIIGGRRW